MSDDKTEASTKPEGEDGGEKDGDIDRHPYLNKTGELIIWCVCVCCRKWRPLDMFIDSFFFLNLASGNGMRFGVFSSQQAHNLKKVPNQPICKGDDFILR